MEIDDIYNYVRQKTIKMACFIDLVFVRHNSETIRSTIMWVMWLESA
jgi:hypothetical protein